MGASGELGGGVSELWLRGIKEEWKTELGFELEAGNGEQWGFSRFLCGNGD